MKRSWWRRELRRSSWMASNRVPPKLTRTYIPPGSVHPTFVFLLYRTIFPCARQQDYPPYSSSLAIITPYHHIRSPSCLMITNQHDTSRHYHESYARNSSVFHIPSTHAFHFPLYAPIFSIAPQPAYAARQSSPCDLDR